MGRPEEVTVSEGLLPEQYWFLKAPGSRQPSSGLGCHPPYQGPRGPQCQLSVRDKTTPSDRRLSLPLGRAATTAGLWCDPSWGFKTSPWSPQAMRQEHGSGPDTPKQWGWAIPKPFRPLSACTAEASRHAALPRGHFSSWGPSPHPDNDQASYLDSRHPGNECELAPMCRCPPARAGLRNSGPKVVDTLGPLTEQFLPKAQRTYAEAVTQTGEELAVAACPERGSHSILLQASQRLPMGGVPEKTLSKNAHPTLGGPAYQACKVQRTEKSHQEGLGTLSCLVCADAQGSEQNTDPFPAMRKGSLEVTELPSPFPRPLAQQEWGLLLLPDPTGSKHTRAQPQRPRRGSTSPTLAGRLESWTAAEGDAAEAEGTNPRLNAAAVTAGLRPQAPEPPQTG